MKRWTLKHRPSGSLSGQFYTRQEARDYRNERRKLGSHWAQYVTPVKCEVEIKETCNGKW